MDALQAVSAARVHHQWFPRLLYYEAYGLSPDTLAELARRGHALQQRGPMCNAQIIVHDEQNARWTGASDPRGMGLAEGF
jgi:gamma-glutamyltranspeptidase/glutathione hydrolase